MRNKAIVTYGIAMAIALTIFVMWLVGGFMEFVLALLVAGALFILVSV